MVNVCCAMQPRNEHPVLAHPLKAFGRHRASALRWRVVVDGKMPHHMRDLLPRTVIYGM